MAQIETCGSFVMQYQQLWHDTFGDDWDFISDLFGCVNADSLHPLYITEGEKVVGAAMMVPYQIRLDGGMASSYYLYGVLTREEYRNQGVCTRLLRRAHSLAAAEGKDFCFLSPATKALERFYIERGYSEARPAGAPMPIKGLDMATYNASLPTPCIQHSAADWNIAQKHFAEGISLPCQFFSISGKEAPDILHSPAIFA